MTLYIVSGMAMDGRWIGKDLRGRDRDIIDQTEGTEKKSRGNAG
jgi:hypothetical protein